MMQQFLILWDYYHPHLLIIVCIVLFLVLGVVYILPDVFMKRVAQSLHRVFWFADTTEQVCSLTIDDAPSPATMDILDVLKEHNVKATFFILSENIPGNEHIVERMIEDGHEIANHLTQDRASIRYTKDEFEHHLLACHSELIQFQPKVKWLRPGSGWFNKDMVDVAEKHSYRIALGNVYPHDAQIKLERVNEYYLRKRTRAGSILIVHDRQWTIGVLEKALPELTNQFRFVSLHELEAHHTPSSKKMK